MVTPPFFYTSISFFQLISHIEYGNKAMIGIVGGMGPHAGVDLVNKIFNLTKANKDQDHLPVVMQSLPHLISDRTDFLSGNSDVNPALAIAKVINTLYNQGANLIGISCNTAHADQIFKEIVTRIPKEVEIIHMIHEVAKYINKFFPSVKKIGVLSTTGTFVSNVYPDCLSKHDLIGIQVSKKIQMDYINPAVFSETYGIKARSNPVSPKAINNLISGINYLDNKGAEIIIMGCTEIPLALKDNKINGKPLIDSTKILARALILKLSPDKLIEKNA